MSYPTLIHVDDYYQYLKDSIIEESIETIPALKEKFEIPCTFDEFIQNILKHSEEIVTGDDFKEKYKLSGEIYKNLLPLYDANEDEDILELEEFLDSFYSNLNTKIIADSILLSGNIPKLKNHE